MRYAIALLFFLALFSVAEAALVTTTSGDKVLSPLLTSNTDTLKQISTGMSFTPNTIAASTSSSMISRKCGYARQRVPYVKLVYWGGSVQVGAPYYGTEVPNDNNESISAWVEYPVGVGDAIGTVTRAQWSGANTLTLTAGTLQTSDAVNVSIPSGAVFCTITYVTPNSGHITYMGGYTAVPMCATCSPSEKTYTATSGVPDNPTDFGGAGNFTTGYITPIAVIGPSKGKAICLLGDSRVQGTLDSGDTSYDIGDLARSVGPEHAYINMGINGHTLASFVWSHEGRAPLFSYCDAVIDEMGANDVNRSDNSSNNPGAAIGYKRKSAYLFSGNHAGIPALPYSWTTIQPFTSTTDGWSTCTNQTASAATTAISSYNTTMRSPATNAVSLHHDLNAGIAANNGGGGPGNCARSATGAKWFANSTTGFYTSDGSHGVRAAELNIKNTSRVNVESAISALAPTTTNPSTFALTTTGATYDTSTPKFGSGALNGGAGGYAYTYNGSAPQSLPVTYGGWVRLSVAGDMFDGMFGGYQSRCVMDTTGTYYGCGIGSDTANLVLDSVGANDSTWHYLEASYDYNVSDGKIHYWVCKDAVLLGTNSSTVTHLVYTSAHGPFVVRAQGESLGTRIFNGSIDDVAIYNTNRYKDNGNACSPVPTVELSGTEPGLIVGYRFNSNGNATLGPEGD